LFRLVKSDYRYFEIEDGKLVIGTNYGYFSAYITEYNAAKLEKILGLNDPLPLITKKNVAINQKLIEKQMEKASNLFRTQNGLIWEDNTLTIYNELRDSGRTIENLYNIGDQILKYVVQFVTMLTTFSKDAMNLEQLQKEFVSGNVVFRISKTPKYFQIENGSLVMETSLNYFNNYHAEFFNQDYLEKCLGKEDPYPLITRKNYEKAKPSYEACFNKMSFAFGRTLVFVDTFEEIYAARKDKISEADLYNLASQVLNYLKQCETELIKFCKSADNLEALQDALSGDQIGIRLGTDNKWIIENGVLWMETNYNYWNSYLNSTFTSENLEKIL